MVSEKPPLQLSDNFMFPKLFHAFRMAVGPGKLMVALPGLIIICLAGYVMDFSRSVIVTPQTQERITELDVYMAAQKV